MSGSAGAGCVWRGLPVLLAVVLAAGSVRADEEAPSGSGSGRTPEDAEDRAGAEGGDGEAEETADEPPPKRPVPDYDGRPDSPPTAGDRLLWIPRVLFAPLYAVSEYVIRAPLGWVVSTAEEQEVPQKVMDFFTFGENRRGAWAPTFLVDFGFRPSVGIFFRLADAGFEDHDFSLHAATWGPDWVSLGLANRFTPDDHPWELALTTSAIRRPDGLFYGIGDSIQDDFRSRYQYEEFKAELRFTAEDLWRESGIQIWHGLRYEDFSNDTCCSGPPIQDRVDQGIFPLPPGFEEGYFVLEQGLELVLDTRRPRPLPGSGVRLRFEGGHFVDLQDPLALRWIKYGGQAAAFVDLTGRNTVFGVTATMELVEALDGEVPFTRLATLSGDGPLRGFVGKRLVGESGAAVVAEYRWPIWMWLDASVHFGVGNVFDGRFDNFAMDRLRMSWGVGVRTVGDRGHSFDLLVAFGTEPFDEGAEVESFRFVFGGTRGF